MIAGLVERRAQWWQALAISLALHGMAAAALLDVIPVFPRRADTLPSAQMDITPLIVETGKVRAATLTAAQRVTAATRAPAAGVDVANPAASKDPLPQFDPQVVRPADDLHTIIAPPPTQPKGIAASRMSGVDGASLQPRAIGAADATDDTAERHVAVSGNSRRDETLAALIGDIRGRLGDSCLLALPQPSARDQLQVTALGADETQFAPLFDDLAPAVDVALVANPVLLDARQCPAISFARARPNYPAFPLRIALDSADIQSGQSLRGTIEGAGRADTLVLLLVDDNGVVQDLTRFFIAGAPDQAEFDVPAHLSGDPRVTGKLLMAIASIAPLETVFAEAGGLAEDFYAALGRETADAIGLQIGLMSFTLR